MTPAFIKIGARIRFTDWVAPRRDGWHYGTIIDGPMSYTVGPGEVWAVRYDGGGESWVNFEMEAHVEEILA